MNILNILLADLHIIRFPCDVKNVMKYPFCPCNKKICLYMHWRPSPLVVVGTVYINDLFLLLLKWSIQ
jgi:hypothetical protein